MSTGGWSEARLGRMHGVMAGYVDRGIVPGLVTLVSRRGETHAAAPDATPILKALSDSSLGQGPPNPQVPPDPDQWIRDLGALPLMYQPGERWMYNTGSDVLGVLIARASDQPFEAFLRERVFEPL